MRVHLSSLSQNKRSSKYHFDINNDVLKQSHTCRQKELLNLLQKEVRFSTSTTDTSISTSFLPMPSLKGYLNFQTSFLCPHTVMTDHMFICSLSQMQQGIRYIRRSLSLSTRRQYLASGPVSARDMCAQSSSALKGRLYSLWRDGKECTACDFFSRTSLTFVWIAVGNRCF